MAKQVTVTTIDDIDQTPGATTVKFGLDGVSYEIDVAPHHEKALRDALEPFVTNATRVTGTGAPKGKKGPSGIDAPAIRKWASDNDVTIPSHGRIAGAVVDAYTLRDVAALKAAMGITEEPKTPSNVVPINPPFEGGNQVTEDETGGKPAKRAAKKAVPAAEFSAPTEKPKTPRAKKA